MTVGYEALSSRCAACRTQFAACPQCVNTVAIDPETGFPPDVERGPDDQPVRVEPSPEAVARSVKTPLCDRCVATHNRQYPDDPWTPWKERHALTHKE